MFGVYSVLGFRGFGIVVGFRVLGSRGFRVYGLETLGIWRDCKGRCGVPSLGTYVDCFETLNAHIY